MTNLILPSSDVLAEQQNALQPSIQAKPTMQDFSSCMLRHGSFALLPNNNVTCVEFRSQ
jgi:hypothetical protein